MAKKLKVGVIGAGMIANHAHIPGYLSIPDECEIKWLCDIKPDVLKEVGTKYSISNLTADYRDLLNDPEIDAVSVATPNLEHMQMTVDALKAGKHVLCEKPLSMNADQSKAMCRAAKDSGKILQVGLQYRFCGPGLFMKEYIDKGHMGDVYYGRAQALRRRGVPGWGVFTNKEKQGGGPLIDIGVHILDFTLFLMGYPKPVSASGKTWDILGKNPNLTNFMGDFDRDKFTVEDMAVGFIRFEDGQVVTLESSFMANIEQEFFKTTLMGTKSGAEVCPGFSNDPIVIFSERDRQVFNERPVNIPDIKSSHVKEVQEFVATIQEGGKSKVPGEHGLILNAIFDALYKSTDTGVEEKIDLSY
ncbi:MAG: Gfo/Idh/MocA family oxidoreductase [Fimbriimonadaceae bacterium]|nr:Gfo/Idh/MocA family oxidoreductase [Fimbriimonadaceae bacterium]